jgi:translation elongation factor EF-1alpha
VNLLDSSDKFEWFKGPTVELCIRRFHQRANQLVEQNKSDPVIVSVAQSFKTAHSVSVAIGRIASGNPYFYFPSLLLSGSLQLGDQVKLYGEKNTFSPVLTLEVDKKGVKEAHKGQVLGVGLQKKVTMQSGDILCKLVWKRKSNLLSFKLP